MQTSRFSTKKIGIRLKHRRELGLKKLRIKKKRKKIKCLYPKKLLICI